MKLILYYFVFFNLIIFSQEKAIHFVTDDNFPPYSYLENGKIVGYDIDVLKEIEKELNIKIEIEAIPWNRVLKYIESGKADGGFSLFKTDEREVWSTFIEPPIRKSTFVIFTKVGNEFQCNSLNDLKNKKVGINRGFSINDEFDKLKLLNKINVIESEDETLNFKLLQNDRIDCYVGNYFSSSNWLSKSGLKNEFSILDYQVVPSRPAYIVLSKKSKYKNIYKIKMDISNVLIKLNNNGKMNELLSNYIH